VHFEVWAFPLFFLTGFLAGFVDSVAGGGGLITLPVLLSTGMPSFMALSTNKLQSSFGSASATFHYARAGLINFRECWDGVVWTFIGSASGTLAVQQLDPEFLKQIIPFLLMGIAIWFLLKPELGAENTHQRMRMGLFHFVFGLLLGFYDGFFGPGAGSFFTIVYVALLGFNLTHATAYTKAMNFTSNFASLIFFLFTQPIAYSVGITMGCGQLLGARLGSKMVLKRGVKFIRPVFITVVLLLTLKLLLSN
jgi:uncharacterized protein